MDTLQLKSLEKNLRILESTLEMYNNSRKEALLRGGNIEFIDNMIEDVCKKIQANKDDIAYAKMGEPEYKTYAEENTIKVDSRYTMSKEEADRMRKEADKIWKSCTNETNYEIPEAMVNTVKVDEKEYYQNNNGVFNGTNPNKVNLDLSQFIDQNNVALSGAEAICCHQFKVRFGDGLPFESYMVERVCDGNGSDSLLITLREFVMDKPLPYMLERMKEEKVKFTLFIDTLREQCKPYYTTEYSDCRIEHIYAHEYNYAETDVNRYEIQIKYDSKKITF